METESKVGIDIRPLLVEELSMCIPGGRAFYKESGVPGTFVDEVFLNTWITLYENDIGVIIGAFEGGRFIGGVGGVVYPDPNDGVLVATEMFWYLSPEARNAGTGKALLGSFYSWAKTSNAGRLIMAALPSSGQKIVDYYMKMGFKVLETQFVKEI